MIARCYCVGAALLLMTGAALAETIVLQPQQQTIVREYVIAHPLQPVEPPAGFEVAVGSVIPDVVEITPLDAPDLGATYSYVVIGKQTLVVDPETRQIVEIVQ